MQASDCYLELQHYYMYFSVYEIKSSTSITWITTEKFSVFNRQRGNHSKIGDKAQKIERTKVTAKSSCPQQQSEERQHTFDWPQIACHKFTINCNQTSVIYMTRARWHRQTKHWTTLKCMRVPSQDGRSYEPQNTGNPLYMHYWTPQTLMPNKVWRLKHSRIDLTT
jgi:hypothetical protein